jgi:polar amino acid transport system substrate-binding protein
MVMVFAAGISACGSANSAAPTTASTIAPGGATTTTAAGPLGASCANAAIQSDLYHAGQLTIATDNPVYTPWFVNNKPENGQGYEAAVAYGVAAALGFTTAQVKWAYEPFNDSYAPGPKHFDFDINEISVTPARAKEVTFSTGYYNVQQSLVALKGTPIDTKHSPAELKTYVYGDQIGTTSLAFINDEIQPTQTPSVFDTLNDVKSALAAHQIAALVADTPTAQYIASAEIPHAVLLAQFPSTGEHYGLLFQKNDKLSVCVDHALDTLKSNGFLKKETKKYLGLYTQVPTIKP